MPSTPRPTLTSSPTKRAPNGPAHCDQRPARSVRDLCRRHGRWRARVLAARCGCGDPGHHRLVRAATIARLQSGSVNTAHSGHSFAERHTPSTNIGRELCPRPADDGVCCRASRGGQLPLHLRKQHEQDRPRPLVLLPVDQQLAKGPGLRVDPEGADRVGPIEVGEAEDVEELGPGSRPEGVQALPQAGSSSSGRILLGRLPRARAQCTSNRLRHADAQQHDAHRNENEGCPPDRQAEADRDPTTDEPAPREVHGINIDDVPGSSSSSAGRTYRLRRSPIGTEPGGRGNGID